MLSANCAILAISLTWLVPRNVTIVTMGRTQEQRVERNVINVLQVPPFRRNSAPLVVFSVVSADSQTAQERSVTHVHGASLQVSPVCLSVTIALTERSLQKVKLSALIVPLALILDLV